MSVTDRILSALTTVIRLETVLELALNRSSRLPGGCWKRMASPPAPEALAVGEAFPADLAAWLATSSSYTLTISTELLEVGASCPSLARPSR